MERALGGRGPEVLAGLQRMQALPGNYLEILERYVGHLVVEGIVQAHEDIRREAQREERRLSAVKLGKLDADPVIPADALDFIRHRRDLGRFFERDQVDTVRRILAQGLEEGWPTKRVEDELRRQLVGVSRHRAHTIARTEATTAFNQGRLAMFQQSGGYVVAVQFSAILDTRTTEMCRARHGLVLALEDAALAANTPPLHYSCRSYLLPISRYQLEKLGGGDFLAAERAKVEGLPRPLPGFDQPEPPVEPTPAPAPPRPTAPGPPKAERPQPRVPELEPADADYPARAGGDRPKPLLPRRAEVAEQEVIRRGEVVIPVRRFWPTKGEYELVELATRYFPPEALSGIRGVAFVGIEENPRGLGGIRGEAAARYRSGWVFLSRVSGESFSLLAPEVDRKRALEIVLHELAHYSFYRTMTSDERKEWLNLMWDRGNMSNRIRAEVFAEQLVAFLVQPERFRLEAGLYPGLREFLVKVLQRWQAHS